MAGIFPSHLYASKVSIEDMTESEEERLEAKSGSKEVKFSEEASLGGVVSKKDLICTLGIEPIKNLEKEL
jgi:hypothetical protein